MDPRNFPEIKYDPLARRYYTDRWDQRGFWVKDYIEVNELQELQKAGNEQDRGGYGRSTNHVVTARDSASTHSLAYHSGYQSGYHAATYPSAQTNLAQLSTPFSRRESRLPGSQQGRSSGTDPPVYHKGAFGKENFKVVRIEDQRKWFRKGRVFKAYKIEQKGLDVKSSSNDFFTQIQVAHLDLHMEVQRYVVIERFDRHSICLPIHTYEGKATTGTAKSNHHFQIYSTDTPSDILEGEHDLLPGPLRVELSDAAMYHLDPASRLCITKTYTIEHNIAVCAVGRLVKEDFDALEKEYYLRTYKKYKPQQEAAIYNELDDLDIDEELRLLDNLVADYHPDNAADHLQGHDDLYELSDDGTDLLTDVRPPKHKSSKARSEREPKERRDSHSKHKSKRKQ